MSQSLIKALQDPALYDHPVTGFEVIETHISWVLLTGHYVYKVKKPVDLGFLDFTTLEKRLHYCQEELRLNQRLAPDLYIDVIAIGGSPDAPSLGASTGIFEYAVKMKQFDEAGRLDHLLDSGQLNPEHIDQLADELAAFHHRAAVAGGDNSYGTAETVWSPVKANFEHIRPLLSHEMDMAQLDRLEHWSRTTFEALRPVFQQRRDDGFIRECHGDAHLANMVLIDDAVVLFDCLEFNPALRWIDVISELAFVVMDLDDRRRPDFANRLLDRYLQRTGDYAGLKLLRFYQVYRALVRAKVATIRLQQEQTPEQVKETWREYHGYVDLAASYTEARQPILTITHGLSGVGKTTVTQELLQRLPLIRVRSDVERKRLFGLQLEGKSETGFKDQMYSADASRRTYNALADLARTIIGAGFGVVVDATFLRQTERQCFSQLSRTLNTPFVILEITADEEVMRKRITHRDRLGRDASEADTSVLEQQLQWHEPLSTDERDSTLTVINNDGFDLSRICSRIETLINNK
jgi:aminoglycoside phosphotransferase family enzyme/predicted kinase